MSMLHDMPSLAITLVLSALKDALCACAGIPCQFITYIMLYYSRWVYI